MAGKALKDYDYAKEQRACLQEHLNIVLGETTIKPELTGCIQRLLQSDKRIPQEVLNYEVMVRLA
ncbi:MULTISPECIES: hypothetical protein [unclassified Paenibacillus]|uniref:hypothetical protein n=1 Tax=unclassified Paenibacillus TaxID=185978 RepID=UPI0024072DF9|nr:MULTISPECIES: hypothetical protein [unclassified Paenibacillus]MDF9839200.1 hypothetical protein [Paenibacillus sp. PastF-2]MDF9852354.1 hypothetical protein [Paenibacillus sp. PastF-1]MDH6477916.1 hypothetical protein [Paenibacillus sp. PastH-2]